MAKEIKYNLEEMKNQKDALQQALDKYVDARRKIRAEIDKVKGDSKGEAMNKLYNAFKEFDNEYADMGNVIGDYITKIDLLIANMRDEDKKQKSKINSI